MQQNCVLWTGHCLILLGTMLVATSFWALGFYATFLGMMFCRLLLLLLMSVFLSNRHLFTNLLRGRWLPQKVNFVDCWARLLTGQMPFLSPNQRHQIADGLLFGHLFPQFADHVAADLGQSDRFYSSFCSFTLSAAVKQLLCGHLIGRIARCARPSVCPSISPVQARNSKTKKR